MELVRSQGRTKSAELAARVGTTAGFLSHAMTPLVAKGWVRSEPGPSGGYTALVDASDVSVLDVIEAVEGRTDTERCVLEDRACAGAEHCALHRQWSSARAHLLADLGGTSIASLTTERPT